MSRWALVIMLLIWQSKSGPITTLWLVLQRMWTAATCTPTLPDAWALLVIVGCAVVALPLGMRSGFLRQPTWPPPESRGEAIKGLFLTFLAPGVLEEIWFRAALLPVREGREALEVFVDMSVGLAAFIIYHVNVGHMKAVFRDGRFLMLAALLGFACTAAFVGCRGSLWPPAVLHGLVVWVWLFCMGGLQQFKG
mmetsp:Transcript_52823/g.171897  ORF Transcript_52823/g.171897 Transcript_52823/m.171897 type:complete len:194 (-) Transcript_52823:91-672(-)